MSAMHTMPPSYGEIRGAILNYMEVVAALFKARREGPALAERQPSQDTECLSVFQQLNDTGRTLKAIADALPKEPEK